MRRPAAQAAKEVIDKESLRPPRQLHLHADPPEHQHIEENMHEPLMEEHVGKKLPRKKITRVERPKVEIALNEIV